VNRPDRNKQKPDPCLRQARFHRAEYVPEGLPEREIEAARDPSLTRTGLIEPDQSGGTRTITVVEWIDRGIPDWVNRMRRRKFITLLGAALTLPAAALAQDGVRTRKLGILANLDSDDEEGKARIKAFTLELAKSGWIEGRNLQTEIRWAGESAEHYREYAKELIAFKPDVLLASASPSVAALQQVTRDVPIIFANVIDPVGAGFVASLARPGGNTTGFTAFEYSISGKWLELLKEVAPNLRRVAVIRDPLVAAGIGQFAAIQTLASGLEITAINPRDPAEIRKAMEAFARERDGGVIITASSPSAIHRNLLLSLALQLRLPSVSPFRYFTSNGGLASYGPATNDEYERAATYVDRVLKGESPANLPVQAPTKYELVINLRTAKALDLSLPQTLLTRADEVIE
jgi:putative ABC transport system substrate-binding protein